MDGLQGPSMEMSKISCPHPAIEIRFRNGPICVIFLDVTPIGWNVFIRVSRKRVIFVFNSEFLPWRWRQYILPELWWRSVELHGVTTQKTLLFRAVEPSGSVTDWKFLGRSSERELLNGGPTSIMIIFLLFLVGWDWLWVFWYCGQYWPIVPAPDDRWWWLWRHWWNEDWQGKPKYSEKTCPNATLPTTNPTWLDRGHRGGKPGTNRLSYSAAFFEACLHRTSVMSWRILVRKADARQFTDLIECRMKTPMYSNLRKIACKPFYCSN
jgi:hypothetical protein